MHQMAREDGLIPMGKPQIIDLHMDWNQEMDASRAAGIEVRIAEIDDAGALHDDTALSELQLLYPGETLAKGCPSTSAHGS